MSPLEFLQFKLSQPGVSLETIASATGLSVRCLSMLKSGRSANPTMRPVIEVARFFGYRFVPAPINSPRPRRRRTGEPSHNGPLGAQDALSRGAAAGTSA